VRVTLVVEKEMCPSGQFQDFISGDVCAAPLLVAVHQAKIMIFIQFGKSGPIRATACSSIPTAMFAAR
jgi:hypothetical protein